MKDEKEVGAKIFNFKDRIKKNRLVPVVLLTSSFFLFSGCSAGRIATELKEAEEALQQKEPAVARAAFETAAEESGQNPQILAQIADAYYRRKHIKEALMWFERAAKKNPSYLTFIANIYMEMNQQDRACEAFARINKAFPDNGITLNNYVYQCFVLPGRDLDRAIPLLQTAVELTEPKQQAIVLDSLGWAYYQRYIKQRNDGDLQKAIDELERAVVQIEGPRSFPLGNLSYDRWSSYEIRKHLREVYNISDAVTVKNKPLSYHWAIKDSLGAVLLQKARSDGNSARLESAMSLLEQSVQRQPGDALNRYHLGLAYLTSHYFDNAYVELQKSVHLDPRFAPAREALERVDQLRSKKLLPAPEEPVPPGKMIPPTFL